MRRPFVVAAAFACLSLAACTPAFAAPATAQRWPANWTLPNHHLTPGATARGYGFKDICPHVNPKLEAMRPTYAQEQQVYREYGITSHRKGQYVIDHLDPVELLGAGMKDLWPEPYSKPDPAMIRKYHLNPKFILNAKDILEDVLHADVCSGKVPLSVAQKAITADWRAAYVKYVGKATGGGSGGTGSAKPWCKATATPANDGWAGDYDVRITSNQPDTDATASDAGDTWSHNTSSTGAVTIRLWNQSPGETIKVTAGGASCSARA